MTTADLFAPRPSAQQEAIFEFVARGTGHGLVRARAGTGKTTTVTNAVGRAPAHARVAVFAYNTRIADELRPRIARLGRRNAEVLTLHALGNRALRKAWGVQGAPDKTRDRRLAAAALPAKYQRAARELAAVASLCKSRLALDEEGIAREVRRSELAVVIPEGPAVEAIQAALAASLERDGTYSFDDMVFVPAAHGWRTGSYDLVFVDEAQDMSAAQLVLAQAALAPSGRLILVGDDRQAIYGWRGADEGGIDRLKAELDAAEFPLSTTYRCPRAVVAEAARVVPDYTCPPSAPEGIVRCTSLERADWRPGDAVLSRLNAPLVGLALSALRAGVPARIQGRDIAAGLAQWVRGLGCAGTAALLRAAEAWRDEELARLGEDDDGREADVRDRVETLRALAEGLGDTAAVLRRLEQLFDDEGDALVFSSVHRAKGLEWDRVFLVAATFRPSRTREEENLWYVALTRAKRELVYVGGAKDAHVDEAIDRALERRAA